MTSTSKTLTGVDTGMSAGSASPPDALLAATAGQLVDQAKATGVALSGQGGLLTSFVQQVLQGALEAGTTEHLGDEPHAIEGRGSRSARNRLFPKAAPDRDR